MMMGRIEKSHNFVHIPDQHRDLETIGAYINITNIGIEAITHIYHDHRSDKESVTKLFALQENLVYRIFAAFHQYELLIAGLKSKSSVDLNTHPYEGDLQSNPVVYRYSNELSSIVDSTFFQLCSVFDYLGHFVSCLFEKNKDNTADWGSLMKKVRAGHYKTLTFPGAIREIDHQLRNKLEWHRSQLIHRKRDMRGVGITVNHQAKRLSLVFAATPETMKYFKNIVPGYDNEAKYTLDCLPSAIFYQTLRSVNYLLDFLSVDLVSGAALEENLKSVNPHPKSIMIWRDYKQKLRKFYGDHSIA